MLQVVSRSRSNVMFRRLDREAAFLETAKGGFDALRNMDCRESVHGNRIIKILHASGVQASYDAWHRTHKSARVTIMSLGHPQEQEEASRCDKHRHPHEVGVDSVFANS